MPAIRIGQPASLETLRLDPSYAAPPPGPGEIRVAVRASSLNFRDRLIAEGVLPAPAGLIPLSDAAGEVVELGAGVERFRVGDRVVSCFHPGWIDGHVERAELTASPGGPKDGFACTTATRGATAFTHAPQDLDFAESATLTCAGVTAWRALVTDGRMKPGATVLVIGTGGVSLFALQFAKVAGAEVFAVTSSTDKAARLTALGADHVLDRTDTPEWGKAVLDLTRGLGVDHVVEVGGPRTLPQSLAAARTAGHVAIIGAVGGFDIDTIPFAIVQAKRLRLQGVTVGSRRDQIDMIRAIDATGLHPVIGARYPLADLAGAFRTLKDGGTMGKIAIDV